nr:hypothetical protein [Candidatus Woesearchaeota archaeon]
MGLDLTIIPLSHGRALSGSILGYDSLNFVRDYRIFAQIADVDGKSAIPEGDIEAIVCTYPLPPGVKVGIYGDNGIRHTRKNPYGEEMVYATAREMRKLSLPEDVSPSNKAIMAYIKALQRDTPIILEWR